MAANCLIPRYNFKSVINTRNFSLGKTLYRRPKGYWGPKRQEGDVVEVNTTLYRQSQIKYGAGLNVGAGRGGHLFAILPGKVLITTEKTNFDVNAHILTCRCPNPEGIPYMQYYNIIPEPQHKRFRLIDKV